MSSADSRRVKLNDQRRLRALDVQTKIKKKLLEQQKANDKQSRITNVMYNEKDKKVNLQALVEFRRYYMKEASGTRGLYDLRARLLNSVEKMRRDYEMERENYEEAVEWRNIRLKQADDMNALIKKTTDQYDQQIDTLKQKIQNLLDTEGLTTELMLIRKKNQSDELLVAKLQMQLESLKLEHDKTKDDFAEIETSFMSLNSQMLSQEHTENTKEAKTTKIRLGVPVPANTFVFKSPLTQRKMKQEEEQKQQQSLHQIISSLNIAMANRRMRTKDKISSLNLIPLPQQTKSTLTPPNSSMRKFSHTPSDLVIPLPRSSYNFTPKVESGFLGSLPLSAESGRDGRCPVSTAEHEMIGINHRDSQIGTNDRRRSVAIGGMHHYSYKGSGNLEVKATTTLTNAIGPHAVDEHTKINFMIKRIERSELDLRNAIAKYNTLVEPNADALVIRETLREKVADIDRIDLELKDEIKVMKDELLLLEQEYRTLEDEIYRVQSHNARLERKIERMNKMQQNTGRRRY